MEVLLETLRDMVQKQELNTIWLEQEKLKSFIFKMEDVPDSGSLKIKLTNTSLSIYLNFTRNSSDKFENIRK